MSVGTGDGEGVSVGTGDGEGVSAMLARVIGPAAPLAVAPITERPTTSIAARSMLTTRRRRRYCMGVYTSVWSDGGQKACPTR
jgi:hypothetical protein